MSCYYYDRAGKRIDMRTWASLFEDPTYRRIAETILDDGTCISTIWLGLDHSLFCEPPLFFETMVFQNRNSYEEIDCKRYSTETQAKLGHEAIVRKWKNKSTNKR